MHPHPTISPCQPPATNADCAMAVMPSAGCVVGTFTVSDDVLNWGRGVWCYRSEFPAFSHLSDDYKVVKAGSPAWSRFASKRARS